MAGPDRSNAGTNRDRPKMLASSGATMRRHLVRDGFVRSNAANSGGVFHANIYTITVEGSSAGMGETQLDLTVGGGDLILDNVGVATANAMVTDTVAVSWKSTNIPTGDWQLLLMKREAGSQFFEDAATFDVWTGEARATALLWSPIPTMAASGYITYRATSAMSPPLPSLSATGAVTDG